MHQHLSLAILHFKTKQFKPAAFGFNEGCGFEYFMTRVKHFFVCCQARSMHIVEAFSFRNKTLQIAG
jgi:hypothetical protein